MKAIGLEESGRDSELSTMQMAPNTKDIGKTI